MEINLLFIIKCLFGGLFIFCLGWLNENRKSLKLRITNLEDRVSTNEKRINTLKNKIDSIETTEHLARKTVVLVEVNKFQIYTTIIYYFHHKWC